MMNDYAHDQYEDYGPTAGDEDDDVYLISQEGASTDDVLDNVNNIDFDDPEIAALPRILLMGPRRSGKSSINVSIETKSYRLHHENRMRQNGCGGGVRVVRYPDFGTSPKT